MKRGFRILEGFAHAKIPQRATKKSAGYDISAAKFALVEPGETVLVETGLTAYMQDDEELQIRPRSGLALKYGITVLNSPGTIDADYEGQHIKVMLYNTSDHYFTVNPGDRIAQAVFAKFLITDDDQPADQERTGGFGHTGV
jgi:dUTP pyrophosphatase